MTVNKELLEALKPFAVYGRVGSRDVEVAAAIAAIAKAEAAQATPKVRTDGCTLCGFCAATGERITKENQAEESIDALTLALEVERDAANLYAKQVAHWIGKHDALLEQQLEATPPASAVSEPLSTSDIVEMADVFNAGLFDYLKFARAIEAAHNIRSK